MEAARTSFSKYQALETAREMSVHISTILMGAGYYGPVVVAGGYIRDLALGNTPKDLDIFLCSKETGTVASGQALADHLGSHLDCTRTKTLKSYGSWAKDVDYVAKLEGALDVDLVVLRHDELTRMGYTGSRESFLRLVLRRVDLRINAIGGSPMCSGTAPEWEEDVRNKRLVVQYERLQDEASGSPTTRILSRLDRFTAEGAKFHGWSKHLEGPHGELAGV